MSNDRPDRSSESAMAETVPELLTNLRRLFAQGDRETLRCRFRYSLGDPYAVSIDLMLAAGLSITWVVSRDLLSAGTRRPAGEGDFKVWPSCRHHGREPRIYFSLDRPEGHVAFEAGLPEVQQWLDRTYQVVPAGRESDLLDLDALADSLLGRE
ncbi:SsgA family sporulation/cell division regulator [Streptomyces tendae]